jgi:hypothetical protein
LTLSRTSSKTIKRCERFCRIFNSGVELLYDLCDALVMGYSGIGGAGA